MNKDEIIKKYTRASGSFGKTKDFIIVEDIPKMLEELNALPPCEMSDKTEKIVEILEEFTYNSFPCTMPGYGDNRTVANQPHEWVVELATRISAAIQPSGGESDDLEQDFKDWLGWNEQPPPDQDNPDYYTYSWGMNVWINAQKYYNK